MTIDIDYLLKGLKQYFETDEMVALVKELGTLPFDARMAPGVLKQAIAVVEKMVVDAKEVGHGKEKRDAVVEFLDKVIVLHRPFEWFDEMAIGVAVDKIIEGLNKNIGKVWLSGLSPMPEIKVEKETK